MLRALSLFIHFFYFFLLYYCFWSQIWFCTDKTLVLVTSWQHTEAKRQARLEQATRGPDTGVGT